MRFEDPLKSWLYIYRDVEACDINTTWITSKLRRLSRFASIPSGAKVSLSEMEELHQLCFRIIEQKGAGKSFAQQTLLDVIGSLANPVSIPFWIELLNLNRPRDSFSATRRTYALAALALLAIRSDTKATWQALQNGLAHEHPETRAAAARYLADVCCEIQRPAPGETTDALRRMAIEDRAFEPRFAARRALVALNQPLPLEYRLGAYAFKVWHAWDATAFRVIELRSEQTLDDLHLAIQQAWNWDDDHLYAFYLNGKKYDRRYEFGHDFVEDAAAYAGEVKVGELGLRPRHKFLYYFDFGDSHQFWVVVKQIRDQAGPGRFSRIVESVGQTMEQYPRWEE